MAYNPLINQFENVYTSSKTTLHKKEQSKKQLTVRGFRMKQRSLDVIRQKLRDIKIEPHFTFQSDFNEQYCRRPRSELQLSTETRPFRVSFGNISDIFDGEEMEIDTYRDLLLLFFRTVYIRDMWIPHDFSSFPNINLFGPGHEKWWGSMKFIYDEFTDNFFESLDLRQQIENIIQCTAIIRRPWSGQKEIVIGCGQSYLFCGSSHTGQYTVDCDPQMGSDCIIHFGTSSLANAIPNAIGNIRKIILEGIMIPENPCFYRDIFTLLEDGGEVYQESNDESSIKKMNGALYCIKNGEHEQYKPWELEIINDEPSLVNLGSDALGWSEQIAKVAMEDKHGCWDYMPKNPPSPFNPDFYKLKPKEDVSESEEDEFYEEEDEFYEDEYDDDF